MSEVVIEQRSLEQVDTATLENLKSLYAQAYYNPHMYEDLIRDMESRPEIFQLFLARTDDVDESVIGARVIESKDHSFIDYHGHAPVHGKRFTVSPDYRGQGIGTTLIEAGKDYCFNELDIQAIFGESNEVGALSLYGRQGALYALGSIEKSLKRNSREDGQRIFAEFLTNPCLRGLRFPAGDGIQFVYCRDKTTADEFRGYDFASYQELVSTDTEADLEDLPDNIAVSEDIELRTIEPNDAEGLAAIIKHNPDIKQHSAWASNVEAVSDVIPILQHYSDEQLSGRYAVWHREQLVGYMGISNGHVPKEYGIGYFLDHQARGHGIATTSLQGLIQQAQTTLGAEHIYLQIKPENADSVGVAKRLGFTAAEIVMGKDFPVPQQRWRIEL